MSEIIDENKIIVIENYSIINLKAVSERKNKINTNTVLFLGFICERKGCYDIPGVAKIVLSKIPDATFILAGSGEIEKIKSIADSEVLKHIIFPGWVRGNEKDDLLKKSDIFFLPSYNEGMPMSILDAMGYGLPVVSTTVGGITKIVHDGENGYVTSPGNIDVFAESIIRILTDDNLKQKMTNKSVEIINNKFSLNQHIDKITELYKRFLY